MNFYRVWIVSLLILFQGTVGFANNYTADEQENIDIYKNKKAGVVNITSLVVSYDFFFRAIPRESGSGSGLIVSNKGHILTNFHVIDRARELTVTLADNTQWPAKVIGVDPNNDLAVLQIDAPPERYTVLKFANSSEIEVGQKALALGNPFGLKHTLTTGIISALGRTIQAENGRKIAGIIQTDAAINPGNSGGPLLNRQGDVIGINTAIIGAAGNVGIGFAIPSNTAKKIIPDLIKYGYVQRPWLGVEPLETQILKRLGLKVPDGLLVISVIPQTAADKAGLQGATKEILVGNYRIPWGGDIITHVGDKEVTSFEQLADIVESYEPGTPVEIRIIRQGKVRVKKAMLTPRPRNSGRR